MEEKTFLTTKDTAQYLGISPATIYRMEKQGLIISSRTPGGQRRFNREQIEKYLRESQKFEAPQNPSKYKKTAIAVNEDKIDYISTPTIQQSEELFFHIDNLWIYNADYNWESHPVIIIDFNSIDSTYSTNCTCPNSISHALGKQLVPEAHRHENVWYRRHIKFPPGVSLKACAGLIFGTVNFFKITMQPLARLTVSTN